MPLVKIRRTRARLHTNFATENDMATSKGNRRRKVRIFLHRSVTGRDKSVARACSDASWREVREAIWRSLRSGSFSREAVSKKMSDTACAATWRGSSEDPTKRCPQYRRWRFFQQTSKGKKRPMEKGEKPVSGQSASSRFVQALNP